MDRRRRPAGNARTPCRISACVTLVVCRSSPSQRLIHSITAVAGCTENKGVNAATGAVVGGAVGNAVSGGSAVGTVAGGALGAAVGAIR